MPAERPIPMMDESVRGIFAGRKTQTRRPVNRRNSELGSGRWDGLRLDEAWVDPGLGDGRYLKAPRRFEGEDLVHRIHPRWERGDVLWVREAWSPDHRDTYPCFEFVYRATEPTDLRRESQEHIRECRYESGGLRHGECLACANGGRGFRWRPWMYMPRRAARLWLRVVDRWPERVQEISEADAQAEGCIPGMDSHSYWTARQSFQAIWDGMHGNKPGLRFANGPWCWAIKFERVDPQEVRRAG